MAHKDLHTAQLPLPETDTRVLRLPLAPASPRGQPGQEAPRRLAPTLWYGLYFPSLEQLPENHQQDLLDRLAAAAGAISSSVSQHPQALACEVRSSLRYFGDLNALHEKLAPALRAILNAEHLDAQFSFAACPTVTGCLLLARSGDNTLVYRRENLRSALGRLPVGVLEMSREQSRRLKNMGLRHLRDIWRLPMAGLRKRFGSDFVRQLQRALGEAPEPTSHYLPPPRFTTACELNYPLENSERLLPILDEMLAPLCDFLRQRDLSSGQLEFTLVHERREATPLVLGLRQASRSRAHFMLLLETQLSNLSLPAPVLAVRLEVTAFDAFLGESEALLPGQADPDRGRSNLDLFMEQLKARLGRQPVQTLDAVAEHCPEYACRQQDYEASRGQARPSPPPPLAPNPRPFWLLPEPLPLTLRAGRLYHRRPLELLNGPERIETRWWTGQDVRRDYYVAREQDGSRLWIFRERSGARRWFLHGVFS